MLFRPSIPSYVSLCVCLLACVCSVVGLLPYLLVWLVGCGFEDACLCVLAYLIACFLAYLFASSFLC